MARDPDSLQSKLFDWAHSSPDGDIRPEMERIRREITPNRADPETKLRFWRIAAGKCGHPDHVEEAFQFDLAHSKPPAAKKKGKSASEPAPAAPPPGCSSRDEVMWVYQMIRRQNVPLSDAPSEGAWNMLQYAQEGSKWFDETKHDGTIVSKFTPGSNIGWFYKEIWRPIAKTDPDKEGERFKDDGQELIKLHEEFEVAVEREEMTA